LAFGGKNGKTANVNPGKTAKRQNEKILLISAKIPVVEIILNEGLDYNFFLIGSVAYFMLY
jgi:hypothetical protein